MPDYDDVSELLAALGVRDTQGRAGINCPRDGQVMLALLDQGADLVVGFEPRPDFHRALIRNTTPRRRFVGLNFNWLFGERGPRFDLFLWLEGYEDHYSAVTQLAAIVTRLEDGGRILVGVRHDAEQTEDEFRSVTMGLSLDAEVVLQRDGRTYWSLKVR